MIGDTQAYLALLRDAIDARVEQVNTCLPGKVLSYDPASQTASVRLTVKRPMRTDTGGTTTEPLPDLPAVPVVFPRAGDFVLHLPLKAGDGVLVLFSQWSTGEYHRTGEDAVDPGDMEHHGMGSAVCIAGLFSGAAPAEGLDATTLLMGIHDGPAIRVTDTKVTVGVDGNPAKKAARKDDTVRVTIPAGAIVVTVPPGGGYGGAVVNVPVAPLDVDGTITSGSDVVDITD